MEDRFKRQGMFSWQELMTDDVEGSKKFYTELLGWSLKEFPMEGGETYWVVKAGEEEVGGIMKTPPEAKGVPAYWGVYITVDDVDASAKKAVELGAKTLVAPMDIPGVGRFATLQDPQGAVFAIITYSAEM
jgi:uncharacterized protein